jgi:hypothetical protein
MPNAHDWLTGSRAFGAPSCCTCVHMEYDQAYRGREGCCAPRFFITQGLAAVLPDNAMMFLERREVGMLRGH